MKQREIISHQHVHLLVTNLHHSALFWEKVIGLMRRSSTETMIEYGTNDSTLVVIESGARTPFKKGYSGLYHLALHIPNEKEFALILARLIALEWPISPTDHIMSKAIYLEDPDGITIEITHETPKRFSHYNMQDGAFQVIDSQGNVRGATEALEIQSLLALLEKPDLEQLLSDDVYIGHVHLYVSDLRQSYEFYKNLGFEDNLISESIGFADLSAGGVFKHRMAMNTWQSKGKPLAPPDSARMKYFQISFSQNKLQNIALSQIKNVVELDGVYQISDPNGNTIRIANI